MYTPFVIGRCYRPFAMGRLSGGQSGFPLFYPFSKSEYPHVTQFDAYHGIRDSLLAMGSKLQLLNLVFPTSASSIYLREQNDIPRAHSVANDENDEAGYSRSRILKRPGCWLGHSCSACSGEHIDDRGGTGSSEVLLYAASRKSGRVSHCPIDFVRHWAGKPVKNHGPASTAQSFAWILHVCKRVKQTQKRSSSVRRRHTTSPFPYYKKRARLSNMAGITQTGSCHCGAVEYKAVGNVAMNVLCHCMNCSRNRGVSPVHLLCVSGACL